MAKKLRLKIIGCGVFEDELRVVVQETTNEADVELLDAGLHATPERLRLRAQEAIDAAARSGRYDAVCLAYGLCGRGTAGLVARDVPLVVPRVHDCISLFLGSARAYAEQFAEHPGTFYFTTGWYKQKAHPEQTRMAAARRFDPELHPHFREFRHKYGEDNARYIVTFLESWRRNYHRAALIDHGFATDEHVATTKAVAEAAGWDYARLEGSLALLQDLVAGDWDEDRFVVIPPGHTLVATNDERIMEPVHIPMGQWGAAAAVPATSVMDRVATGSHLCGDKTTGRVEADIGLGIDAGGTYTDAVLYEFGPARLRSKAKAITTYHDLTEGIAQALAGLDRSLFGRVSYTCLSTTLATNAIVEGRGRPVGLIVMPYHAALVRSIRTPLFRHISARMNIQGLSELAVDAAEVLRAAEEMVQDGAMSFAVSGYAAVRNPGHERQVKQILQERYDMPVVCGHELSGRLDFIARAHTAVLNARLLPLIEELLRSVERVLADAGIGGPLFVVRGDGSIVRKEVALVRAIETVLSGPAASAAGGRFLTGSRDALVVDMGGTTTDIAALRDARIALAPEGAQVGQWRTSVAAADVQTSGLGGDSAVRPGGRDHVQIGPKRVIPLSFLATQWPAVRQELERVTAEHYRDATPGDVLDFFVLIRELPGLPLDKHERRIVECLRQRPHSRRQLAQACRCLAPRLLRVGRLERVGVVTRAGVTPTDALHVLGEYNEFDTEVARLGLAALGRFLGMTATRLALRIKEEVQRQLALAVMRRELTTEGAGCPPEQFAGLRRLLERALEDDRDEPFQIRWRQSRPVIGIGAPVAAYLPGACRLLGTEPIIPPDADVANAIGAVISEVIVTERMRIRPGAYGNYILYGPDGRREFGQIEEAQKVAEDAMVNLIRERARGFGTTEEQVRVEVSRRVGRLQDGSALLIEVEVEGFLAGAPAIGQVTRR